MARPAADPPQSTPKFAFPDRVEPRSRGLRRLCIAVGAFLVALGAWSYWPTIVGLIRVWDSSPDYSHGYLVLPLAVLFLWLRRDRLPHYHLNPSWWGFSLIGLTAVLRVIGGRFYLPELDSYSIPIWLAGVCWLFGGGRFLLWTMPSLLFLFFMVPLPATVETLLSRPLQALATTMSTWTLQSLGQPAIAEGTTILLGDNVLEVERACSGLRMFYGILALSVATTIITRARWSVALCLLAAVAPVAILANTLRITTTGLLYEFVSGESARKFSHDLAGILMIALAIVFFLAVLWFTERTMLRFHRTRARAFLQMAIAFLVVAAVIPCGYFWHERQQSRTVDRFLKHADKLQEEGKDLDAIVFLDRYLHFNPNDMGVRVRLVRTVDKVATNPLRKIRRDGALPGHVEPRSQSRGARRALCRPGDRAGSLRRGALRLVAIGDGRPQARRLVRGRSGNCDAPHERCPALCRPPEGAGALGSLDAGRRRYARRGMAEDRHRVPGCDPSESRRHRASRPSGRYRAAPAEKQPRSDAAKGGR